MTCKTSWNRYPGQCQAQPAYLEIRESGDIYCSWDGQIGNAKPARVWFDIDIRFPVSNELDEKQIEELIKEVEPLAKELLDKTEVAWDGNNHRRKIKGEAQEIYDRIQVICEEMEPDDTYCDDENCDHCNYEG